MRSAELPIRDEKSMRDTRGYAARRLTGSLWVPAGLARGRAATLVAAISTLALIAVLYVDMPLTVRSAAVAGAPDGTAPHPIASGLCLTAAATVPTGAGASRGCTGPGAAGAELPHRAGSAEPPTAPGPRVRPDPSSVVEQVTDLVYRSARPGEPADRGWSGVETGLAVG
jgi:hypothetical protein